MGWRQQLDAVADQLYQFDRDLADLDGLLRQFATDSSQLSLPGPVDSFLQGCFWDLDDAVKLLRRIFDTVFLPVVEPEVAREFHRYLKGLHSDHQQHVVGPIGHVTQRLAESYRPPEEHAQYHKSIPAAVADAHATDALLAELAGNVDATIGISEDMAEKLIILLGIILLVAAAVAALVASALFSTPVSAPTIVGGTAGGGAEVAAVTAAQATLLAQLGALVAANVPSIIWGVAAIALAVAGTEIEVNPTVRKQIEEALERALKGQPDDNPQDNPTPGGSQDPGPWVDPFPNPRKPDTKDEQPCSKEDFVTFAVKLTPTGSPSYGAQYVADVIKAHGEAEACYILRELTDIYADPALLAGDDAGLITVQNYMLQGDNSWWFTGAFFELQWLHDHMPDVTAIEPTQNGYQGADALGISQWGPSVIDCKSYASSSFSWSTMLDQARGYAEAYPGRAIIFVCDGSKVKTPAEQESLMARFQANVADKMPGVVVKITFWTPPVPTPTSSPPASPSPDA